MDYTKPNGEALRRIKDALLHDILDCAEADDYRPEIDSALSSAHGLLTWAYANTYGGGWHNRIVRTADDLPDFYQIEGLLAAAPDLLAEAEKAVAAMKMLGIGANETGLRAAIAKAKGVE